MSLFHEFLSGFKLKYRLAFDRASSSTSSTTSSYSFSSPAVARAHTDPEEGEKPVYEERMCMLKS
ncbi:hypothetical protein D9758_017668 [Tetrapyrgos nigripes]|uniref:Uncharacterized protein n=1 Tax=Tetrapyrgos nigripes TaxID=182062 RepID=A0A8H5C2Z8_9AGAR|nr:hypothetical protein D9758_017668 [Tetrapyrgos nigripes]